MLRQTVWQIGIQAQIGARASTAPRIASPRTSLDDGMNTSSRTRHPSAQSCEIASRHASTCATTRGAFEAILRIEAPSVRCRNPSTTMATPYGRSNGEALDGSRNACPTTEWLVELNGGGQKDPPERAPHPDSTCSDKLIIIKALGCRVVDQEGEYRP